MQPFLKWAGGKRQLLPFLRRYTPQSYRSYYEPFIGAGAMLLDLAPSKAIVNDANSELINCYQVIKEQPVRLLEELAKHENTKEHFYSVREWDRQSNYGRLGAVKKAARIIYLNKTCYNGLFRVNQKGHFNVPFGKYKNPRMADAESIKALSAYFNDNDVTFINGDFEAAAKTAGKGDFVYFDPPYDPLNETSSFTSYHQNHFGKDAQKRLFKLYDKLAKKGCHVMLSNSSTDFIKDLYKDYHILTIPATRSINSVASKRGKVNEFLILNYAPGEGL